MKRTICILLLTAFSLLSQAADGLRLTTVVIDPGHGGHDPGAVSADRKTYEKTIVLDISQKLAARIREAYPDVKVVMTRSTDKFVSLDDRATIANKADANLFISIHINAAKSTSPNGYSLHILGQSSNKDRDLFAYNMDVCKRENSVISLEEDTTRYEGFDPDDPESQIFAMLMQNAFLEQSFKFAEDVSGALRGGPVKVSRGIWQNPFYVLWKTSMPAVLAELGFISNATDLSALRDASKRQDLADRLFEAFKTYKTSYDGQDSAVPAAASQSPAASAQDDSGVLYGTQIFAVGKTMAEDSKEFLGFKPAVVKAGSVNKYIIGVSSSLPEAKKNLGTIKKKYPDSFLVKIYDGKTELIK